MQQLVGATLLAVSRRRNKELLTSRRTQIFLEAAPTFLAASQLTNLYVPLNASVVAFFSSSSDHYSLDVGQVLSCPPAPGFRFSCLLP